MNKDLLFFYEDKTKAEFDLELFSKQYANENKPLFLIFDQETGMPGCFYISSDMMEINSSNVVAIALNGKVFKPE